MEPRSVAGETYYAALRLLGPLPALSHPRLRVTGLPNRGTVGRETPLLAGHPLRDEIAK